MFYDTEEKQIDWKRQREREREGREKEGERERGGEQRSEIIWVDSTVFDGMSL